MMCFIFIFKGNCIIQQGMQIDDGKSAYAYAKEKGCSVRKWEMYGLEHFWQLQEEVRSEVKEFIKSLL